MGSPGIFAEEAERFGKLATQGSGSSLECAEDLIQEVTRARSDSLGRKLDTEDVFSGVSNESLERCGEDTAPDETFGDCALGRIEL